MATIIITHSDKHISTHHDIEIHSTLVNGVYMGKVKASDLRFIAYSGNRYITVLSEDNQTFYYREIVHHV